MGANRIKAIVVGVIGILVFGYAVVWVFLFPTPPKTLSDLIMVKGVVASAEELRQKDSVTLQVWLREVDLPFRSSGMYPEYYETNLMELLGPGSTVTLGIVAAEQSSPRRAYIQGQSFREICTFDVEGHTMLSLDEYN